MLQEFAVLFHGLLLGFYPKEDKHHKNLKTYGYIVPTDFASTLHLKLEVSTETRSAKIYVGDQHTKS
jgi:hypothetical protein